MVEEGLLTGGLAGQRVEDLFQDRQHTGVWGRGGGWSWCSYSSTHHMHTSQQDDVGVFTILAGVFVTMATLDKELCTEFHNMSALLSNRLLGNLQTWGERQESWAE